MGWKSINKDVVSKLLSHDLPNEVINKTLNNNLLVNSDVPARVVSVNDSVMNIFNKIKSKGIQPLFLGLSVLDTKDFIKARLSLPFASLVSSLKVNKVIVNKKAEQLFLYGRDVWSESIINVEGIIHKGGLVFVFNQQHLFIGIAFALSDKLLGKARQVVLRNVADIGLFLRLERQ